MNGSVTSGRAFLLAEGDGPPRRPVGDAGSGSGGLADRAGHVPRVGGAAVAAAHDLDVADAPERARLAGDGVGPEERERHAHAELAVAQVVADARARPVDAGGAVCELLDAGGRLLLELCG